MAEKLLVQRAGSESLPMKANMVDGVNASTAVAVLALITGKRLSVRSVVLSSATAQTAWVEDDDGNAVVPAMALAAGGTVNLGPFQPGAFPGAVSKGLKVKASISGVISGMIEAFVSEA